MQKIQAVLGIFLMVTVYGLPSGLHLNLCVGEDGHWDISAIACTSGQQVPFSRPPNADPVNHHGACTDFTAACHEKKICIPDGVPFIQKVSAKSFQLTPHAERPTSPTLAANRSSAFSSSQETSFSLPLYLRTVVLLI